MRTDLSVVKKKQQPYLTTRKQNHSNHQDNAENKRFLSLGIAFAK